MSENENNQYRLLSPWAYVGYGILFTLPVIGWILAIVFALNDDNLNPRNFIKTHKKRCIAVVAAAAVLVAVIVVVILSIVGMVMGVSIMDGFSSYQYNYRY